jgi:glycogen synthase
MNKRHLQRALGLTQDDSAPLFFWPSRLDPLQKGCQLLAEADKQHQIERIMRESAATFSHANTARHYIDLYERMLERPLIS